MSAVNNMFSTLWRSPILRWSVRILMALLLCCASILVMLSTEQGNRFFFNRILSQQNILSYQYMGGNIWQGVKLNDVRVDLGDVQITAEQAKVHLGWRAILAQEIHLFKSDIQHLRIINNGVSDGSPFSYPKLELPVNLRFNQLNVSQLTIQNKSSEGKVIKTELHDIQINDALWHKTKLSFENTRVNLYNIYISHADGFIDFKEKYPLLLDAQVKIPALVDSLQMKTIYAHAEGDLSQIYGGVATKTPDLLTGWIVVKPMDENVPMNGKLIFKQYHLPFLQDEKLFVKQGDAIFKGDIDGFDIDLNADISGKHLPQGQYSAKMFTDFVSGLQLKSSTVDILSGQMQLTGDVNWENSHDLKWAVNADFSHLNPTEDVLAKDIRQFLPDILTGQIKTQGRLGQGIQTQTQLTFNQQEQWNVTFNQANLSHKNQPIQLDIAWKNINRELPYIVGLNSPTGQAKITLAERQFIDFNTRLEPFADSFLPQGDYQGKLWLNSEQLSVEQLHYQHQQAQLNATAQVNFPSQHQKLSWAVQTDMNGFNPQYINKNIPFQRLSGRVDVNGTAQDTKQIININNMQLQGKLNPEMTSAVAEDIQLTGNADLNLSFKDNGDFDNYAVNYDGQFKAVQPSTQQNPTMTAFQQNGVLQLNINGSTDALNIEKLYHDGVAGKINATGQVKFGEQLHWNIQSDVLHLQPQYFYAPLHGDISGIVKTQGEWSKQRKQIDVQQLNLTGTLNKQPVRAVGQLSFDVNQLNKGLKGQQFQANQLHLSYANNQLQVTGNPTGLLMKIDANHLSSLYPELKGRIYGELSLLKQQRLQLNSNLAVEDLAFADVFHLKKLRLQGELPISETTPSQLNLNIEQLSAMGKRIEHATASLTGTYITHLLKLDSQLAQAKFAIQLAGGFNNKGYWLGQIQHGLFASKRMRLEQKQATDVSYHLANSSLRIAEHCWFNQHNRLCFDEDITVSPEQANVSLMTKNVEIQDFDAFIPDGMQITGSLNGYAKAKWKKGQAPSLDAQLFTRHGMIGLVGEDDEQGTSLAYDNLSILAKTTSEGLLVRTDVSTPNIGQGYAKVLIHPEQKGMPIDGEVAFNEIQLQVFKAFIPDARELSGILSIAGKIKGQLTDPEFNGDLRLKNGVFRLNNLPVDLNQIEIYSAIRQNNANINGVFHSGKGLATLTGQAGWGNNPFLRLKVKGNNLLVRQAPQITAGVNPDVSIEILPKQQRLTVDGQIDIPRALINMPEMRASAVPVSPDVRVVRSDQDVLNKLKTAQAWDIRANLALSLGEQVIFQGFDSRVPLAGKLQLSQRGTELAMRANGAIGVTQSVPISAYGQTLQLNRAIARFNGLLLNPILDIDASKSVQGQRVGVRVQGASLAPNIQIYSDAGLSEQEALNALVTGQMTNNSTNSTTTTESFKSDVNNAVAAAGISMGLGGTRALTNQIGRAFGLSGLALDAQGTGNDTQVSITGYITPDLYLRYGVGVFTPVNRLTMRYQINKRLYLEASQDTERAIDLFYNWRF